MGMAPTQLGPCCPGGCPQPPRGCCLAASLPAAPPSPPQPWLGGRDAFWHGPSTGCPPWPRGAEGPQMLSQCSFQPAGCQLPLLPALCLSVLLLQTVGVTRGAPPPHRTSLGGGTNPAFLGINPAPLAPAGAGARLPSAPSHPPNPCGFAGAWAGGSPPSFPPLHPSFFLPVPVCLPEPRSLCPRPLSLSLPGATLSHSLILCRWT